MKKVCGNCFTVTSGQTCKKCGYTSGKAPLYALSAGTRLNKRYIVGRVLGQGGFGITYLAYDEEEGHIAAIKEFYPYGVAVRAADNKNLEPLSELQSGDFSEGTERFCREAELISHFKNSAEILGVRDCFKENGTAYYAMEPAIGITLSDYCEKYGNITPPQVVGIMRQTALAFSVLHKGNAIHRDASPDNIMLCRNGKVRLLDFGAARELDNGKSYSVIVKEGYAPIEQYQRHGNQGAHTDIYTLGASMYRSLTGITPDDPMTRMEDETSFIRGLEHIDSRLRGIIRRCTMLRPEERYRSAEELLSELDECGITEEWFSEDRLNNTAEFPANPPARRKKTAALIAAGSAVSAAAAGIVALFSNAFAPPQEVKIGGEMYSVELTQLDLSDRELTNAQIANLRHMKKLTRLDLKNNYLTDLSCLSGLTGLKEIWFDNNSVTDIGFMKDMNSLTTISAENNMISDISPLSGKTTLVNVYFGDNYITDITPLSDSRVLENVSFNEAQIGSLDALEGMTELKMVCLSGCNLTDISPLSSSKGLTYVYVGRNRLSDFSPLKNCTSITELYMDNNDLKNGIETLEGVTVNGFIAAEGNGLTNSEVDRIIQLMNGKFEIYH